MTACCTYPGCGSCALNIAPASRLCDVHFYKVQRDELLEAFQEFLNHGFCSDAEDRAKARAAISKATGGAA